MRETDPEGNISDPAEITFTLDTTPPEAPEVDPQTTTDNSPVISGSFDSGDNDATLSVTVDGTTYTLRADPELTSEGDTWYLDLSNAPLPEGTHSITATATDTAGNTSSDPTADELIIDSTPPATPTVNSRVTSDTTPTLTGTFVSADTETLTVTINGTTYTLDSDPELTSSGDTWTLELDGTPALTIGTYDVLASATDALGNTAPDTTTGELTIHSDQLGTPSIKNQVTNDPTPVITGAFDSFNTTSLKVTVNGITYQGEIALNRNPTQKHKDTI